MPSFVAYYRVSTKRQGASGLGIEAQQQTVSQFAKAKNGTIIAEFTEVESGKNNNRIELQKAIQKAKNHNATLLIAKLDRLSRNASFIMTLKDSGAEFIACDLPDANTLTIGIFASIAQWERERISERIREALAAKKRQGYKLGKPENLTKDASVKGGQANALRSREHKANKHAWSIIKLLRRDGKSYADIAQELNSAGLTTTNGKSFLPMTVLRIWRMYGHNLQKDLSKEMP
jgi:DNA invertase Pin-like site-specific DNA recombinase